MKPWHYRDAIERAVAAGNNDVIDSIADRLAQCEDAIQILRAKGYGEPGLSIAMIARQVPDAEKT